MYYVRVYVSVGGKVTARPSMGAGKKQGGWDVCADRRDETVLPPNYLFTEVAKQNGGKMLFHPARNSLRETRGKSLPQKTMNKKNERALRVVSKYKNTKALNPVISQPQERHFIYQDHTK